MAAVLSELYRILRQIATMLINVCEVMIEFLAFNDHSLLPNAEILQVRPVTSA